MGNVHMEATQVNYREGNKKMSVAEAIKNAGSEITPEEKTWIDSIPALTTSNAGKTDQTVIAPEFDAEAGVYAVGDLVMYEGKLYEFTSAHETPGDWDATEVTEKTVADEIDSVKSGLIDVTDCIGWSKRKNFMPLSTRSNFMLVNDNATWSGDTCVIDSATFTFTFNEHDVLTSIKVEGNGTALSDDVTLNVTPRVRRGLYVPNGDYILSGCPANGSASTYRMFLQKVSSGSYGTLANDTGSGASFTVDNAIDNIICRIALYKDYIIPSGGLMFYPMIRPASISDSTFEPAKPALGDFAWDTSEKLPYVPNASGTYTLKATRSANGLVYSWVTDTP